MKSLLKLLPLIYFSLACVAISFSCKNRSGDNLPTSENFDILQLGEGVYACIHKLGGKAICNIGIVDNGDATIIFDNFLSPEAAVEIEPIVASLDLSPIKYVINSHYHNDHIRGNQVFSYDVEILSTAETAALIAKWEPQEIQSEKEYAPPRFAYYDSLLTVYEGDKTDDHYKEILMWRPYYDILSKSHVEVQTRIPDLYIDDEFELNGPKRKVILYTKGKGHTESDIFLHLPDDGVVFTGDLVFNQCHPYLAHGFVEDWKARLDFIYQLDPVQVVPGHGPLGKKQTVAYMKKYIEDVEAHALANISNEVDMGSEAFFDIPEQYKSWWFGRFYRPNLIFMYEGFQSEGPQ